MLTPEAYIESLLGAGASVKIDDREIDLAAEVAIPHGEDIEDLLRDQPVRVAVWKRIRARALRVRDRLRDELKEMESVKFIHYYKAHEETERAEWERFHGDETEDRDAFGRHKAARDRVARGERGASLRWRRNFSDDLVWSYVRSDDEVLEKRAELRRAQNQIELAEVLCEAMDHRGRCLSHLAAIHRDLARAG